MVSIFQSTNVVTTFVTTDVERKPIGSQQDEARQAADDSTVTILEWMNLGEAVMEPCRLDFRGYFQRCVLSVESNQLVYFGGYLFGWTVLMDSPIRPLRIIGPLLPVTFEQRDPRGTTKMVNCLHILLMARQYLV